MVLSDRASSLGLCVVAFLAFSCGSGKPSDETAASQETPATGEPTAQQLYEHYMSQAGMAIAEDRLQDALDAYLEAAKALDSTGEVTVERAEAHFLAADMAYQRMEKELALESYQRSVDIYLRFSGNSKIKAAVALTNMGVIYKEMADKSKARNAWEQALQIYKEAPPSAQNNIHMQKVEQNLRDLDQGF